MRSGRRRLALNRLTSSAWARRITSGSMVPALAAPCSELHFDRGESYGCGSPDCGVGCECDRFVEIWNLVFTQFENDGNGNYTRLEHPNIDTGMGIERLACMVQNVDNIFEIDTMQRIMGHIMRIAGVKYGEDAKNDVSLRVITDHIRLHHFF